MVVASHFRAITSRPVQVNGTYEDDKRIIIWSIKTWKPVKVIDGHAGELFQVEFSPDSDYLVLMFNPSTHRLPMVKLTYGTGGQVPSLIHV
jgi:WD40 repeat protein